MLSVILFLIYLVLVSFLRYEEPRQQSLDRFISEIDEVMQTDFPVVSTAVHSNEVEEKQEVLYNDLQPLPTSLRGIRAYIIENSLQSDIRELIGKSYSQCKLAELQLALSQL
jgi:hypothetical protein